MSIAGGSSARYYRCTDFKKRGTCPNGLSVREDVVRSRVLGAVRERLSSPAAIAHMRKRIAERLGELSQRATSERNERLALLVRTEARIHGLVQFIADGDRSEYVRTALRDLEVQARTEKDAIAALERGVSTPVRLPRPEDVIERAMDLEAMIARDPMQGRERLRQFFEDGRILLRPQPAGFYLAESKFLPLMLFAETPRAQSPGGSGPRAPAVSCAGLQLDLPDPQIAEKFAYWVPLDEAIAVGWE